jgi:cytosine deaminase
MVDLVLRRALIEEAASVADVAVDDGRIVHVGSALDLSGREEIDLDGQLLLPGLVNPHIHLDKAFVGNLSASGIMTDGVSAGTRLKQQYTKEDVKARARRALDLAIRHGTTALRTAADVDPILGTLCVEALLELREEYANRITVQVLAFPQEGFLGVDGMEELMRRALALGADVMGGRPHGDASPDIERHITRVFAIAEEFGKPVDMSVDAIFPPEPADPSQLALRRLADRVIAEGWQGRVTAHHVLALSALTAEQAAPLIERLRAADLNIVFNPISNLFTEGRTDPTNPRRGLTRVKDLWRAGVNVAFGTDNVDDTYLPYVNVDLIKEGLVASAAAHMGTAEERRELVRMMTHRAARVLGIDGGYGIGEGRRADLLVLAARSYDEVITTAPEKSAVFKGGRLVANNECTSRLF